MNKGHLVPPVWDAQHIAEVAYAAGWRDVNNLTMSVAVALAECDGYIGSYDQNMSPDGKTEVSRDVGIWQINIPADDIGTHIEKALYNPATNATAAYKLWAERGWEPWVSYSSGVVYDDTYVYRAALGVFNFTAVALVRGQAAIPNRRAKHSLSVPVVSSPQLAVLYPNVPGLI